MIYTRLLSLGVLVLGLCASALQARNVVVLPSSTSPTGTAVVLTGDPFATGTTFTVPSSAFKVLAKPTSVAGDVKYYVVARSGTGTVTILTASFSPIGAAFNFGQAAQEAALTPDGSKLVVVAGGLRVLDTALDAELLQFAPVDVGINPTDVAISLDSRRAFILSPTSQRLTAVDLSTAAVVGSVNIPGSNATAVSVGPNGLVYVSTQNRVLEIDGGRPTLDPAAVRRQFTVNGLPGKIQFTPDGTRAVMLNLQPAAGSLAFVISLDYVQSSVAILPNTTPGLTGLVLEKFVVAGNNRAFAVSSATSVPAKRAYQINLPSAPPGGGALPDAGLMESFFGGLGNIPIVESVAVSEELPDPRFLYVVAPLNVLQSLVPNRVYRIRLFTTSLEGELNVGATPGEAVFAGPAAVPSTDPPGGIIQYNLSQPALPPGGRSLPLVLRLVSSIGRPLYNVPVSFATTAIGATFDGTSLVNTNAQGFASVRVNMPTTTGGFNVIATVTGAGLAAAFPLAVDPSAVPPPGTGPGTGPGATVGGLRIVSGNGQVIFDNSSTNQRLVVRLTDATGNPVAGASVLWRVGQGFLQEGSTTLTFGERITTTDATGQTSNVYSASPLTLGQSSGQVTVNVSTTDSAVEFHVTLIPGVIGGFPGTFPSTTILVPSEDVLTVTGKSGEVRAGAFQVRVTTSSGPVIGGPLMNVGLTVSGTAEEGGPTARCVPNPTTLTDGTGVATCDVLFSGRAGTTRLALNVGGYFERFYNLVVRAGDPGLMRIIRGDGQSGLPGETLPAALVAEISDGFGNTLPGAAVAWEVISGTATLLNTISAGDFAGLVSTRVRLGGGGPVQIRVRAVAGTQPSVTFNLITNVTLAQFLRVSGDGQTAFLNQAFGLPLVVQVNDDRNQPVPGTAVAFAVTGPATLSAATATTDAQGRASISVRAGGTPGQVVVRATVGALPAVTFTLTVIPPGPALDASRIYNTASGRPGVVPGGIVTIAGPGIAPTVQGVVTPNSIIGPLPTRLAGVEVIFGNIPAPIYHVANVSGMESVTVQAPFELGAPGAVSITVRVSGGSSTINNIPVVPLQPGLFETVDASGRRYAVVQRPDGTYVSPENPARRGEVLKAYFTGAGQVTPATSTNRAGVGGQSPLRPLIVGVNDGGVRVVSTEYAINLIGVYVVSFEVPADTATGPARNFAIAVVGADGVPVFANGSSIAIQ